MLESEISEGRGGLYERYVNPQRARLLNVLQMNAAYVRASGAELHTADGRCLLDILSGYCAHNVGHNHPNVVAAIKEELDRQGPVILQSRVYELAGELAARLCTSAGGRLTRAFFASSGSEAVEAVIKFARAHTGRSAMLYAEGGFHGLTCGALSLVSNPLWTEGFGALLPDTESVPFGSLAELERRLTTQRFAAFVVEPVQGENGIRVAPRGYLRRAEALCRRYGTLLVLDEVQTGLYRTGPFLAAHHFGVDPDMVVLAKALSGGLVPSAAVLMSDAVSDSVYTSLKRALVHSSTFAENSLAMRAGLATLDVLEGEQLGRRAAESGERLRSRLVEELRGYEMFGEVRGLGLLCGIEFATPRRFRLRLPFEAFARIHPAMFGQVVVMRLFRDHAILSQICNNDFMVLKVAPPLVIAEDQIERSVAGIRALFELIHTSATFWTEALGLARRLMKV